MMTGLLLFLGLAYASDPIDRPAAPEPVKGECLKVLPINKGQSPTTVLLDTNGVANCSGLVVPLSQFSDLLQTEKWAVAVQSQYKIETSRLEMERDWYKEQLNDALKPKPWLERPGTQRWLGRIETIVIVGIVTAGLGATYHYTSGAGQ
tara:strand:- start:841 stop:1287 length:447 start_codon:yes stop_codon:yes gene_type:complete